MDKQYQIVNGTYYDARTDKRIVTVLESARQKRERIVIAWGDAATGKDWCEEFETTGYVGRSIGPHKIPLLIPNARSMGGPGILDYCIVKISTTRGKHVLYQHPQYHKEE